MKKNQITVGMEAVHAESGKPLGTVTSIGPTVVQLDNHGERGIATPAEMSKK